MVSRCLSLNYQLAREFMVKIEADIFKAYEPLVMDVGRLMQPSHYLLIVDST